MTAIPEPAPQDARDRQRRGALLIDVREPHEHATGMAEGAFTRCAAAPAAFSGSTQPLGFAQQIDGSEFASVFKLMSFHHFVKVLVHLEDP